jgi:hypothetical protein
MPPLLLPIVTVLLLMCLLSGCSLVTIRDETLYFPFGSNSGVVTEHTLDSDQDILTAPQWNSILDTQPIVCMGTGAYGDIKRAYETLCSVMPTACTYETQQVMASLFLRSEKTMAAQVKMIRKRKK